MSCLNQRTIKTNSLNVSQGVSRRGILTQANNNDLCGDDRLSNNLISYNIREKDGNPYFNRNLIENVEYKKM